MAPPVTERGLKSVVWQTLVLAVPEMGGELEDEAFTPATVSVWALLGRALAAKSRPG